MLKIHPIPAFTDNYIWILHDAKSAVIVDPGDANPVIKYLAEQNLNLVNILITHHHNDHIDGVAALLKAYPTVQIYAPKSGVYYFRHTAVDDGEIIKIHLLPLEFKVIAVPGHTLDHIAFYSIDNKGILFCGDTLFSAGCGRLFEGTAAQMAASLYKFLQLPDETQVYCTHEYTEANLQFAALEEPENIDIKKYLLEVQQLRIASKPSLPSSIGREKKINLFLRCLLPSNSNQNPSLTEGQIQKFSVIRHKKNLF